jgi:voltage-gated potassium channel
VPLLHVGPGAKLGQARYRDWLRLIRRTVLILLATIAVCASGLYLLSSTGGASGDRLFDALWNTAATISTLGALSPLNDGQKAFMIVAMLTLVGIGGYAITSLTGALSREDIQIYLGNRRMEKIIADLKDHVLLAGFGPVGRIIAAKLKDAKQTVVVIDRDSDVAETASHLGYLTVHGSISQDGVLEQVHTERAKALVVTIPDPDKMVAATLMARMLNPALLIYAVTESGNPWLTHAGASDVVFGDEVIAQEVMSRLAAKVSRP